MDTLGSPSQSNWPGFSTKGLGGMSFKVTDPKQPLADILPGASREGVALVARLMRYGPSLRLSATEVFLRMSASLRPKHPKPRTNDRVHHASN